MMGQFKTPGCLSTSLERRATDDQSPPASLISSAEDSPLQLHISALDELQSGGGVDTKWGAVEEEQREMQESRIKEELR